MKILILSALSLALLAPASVAQASSRPSETSELHARFDPGLEALRAGGPQEASALRTDEREALREAEAADPALADLRAGGVIEILLILVLILLLLRLL